MDRKHVFRWQGGIQVAVMGFLLIASSAFAQNTNGNDRDAANARRSDAEERANQALESTPTERPTDQPAVLPAPQVVPSMNLLDLAFSGGILMIPIGLISLIMIGFAIERFLALRRRKLVPAPLVESITQAHSRPGGIVPKSVYKLAQSYPSSLSNVLRNVLLKVGRPANEVERSLQDGLQREATRLYRNVRPIELAISVAPLLGLLGTVQGMISAFYVSANLPTNANRAEQLAGGIYVALVTTFAGLCVAIPAAMLVHYFEGRIQRSCQETADIIEGIMPQLERYEGKIRFSANDTNDVAAPESAPPPDRVTAGVTGTRK